MTRQYTEAMPQTTSWKHFVLGYKMGKSKLTGHPCWMSEDGPEASESISDSIASAGKGGWELVSCIYIPKQASGGEEIMCFFKMPA
jgi:hypothetical protein